jgi:predicted flap endonuclease-1-like 5' DNA nuclease
MSLLLRVLDAAYCQSTHHKLALDALGHLRGAQAASWRDFLVTHHRPYFQGAKDPDTTFKDFTNHVLHVRDAYWGGARIQARAWYAATVRALWKKDWTLAAYNAGVLSHYVTDPLMPLHTGQSPRETPVHRAVEWTIRLTYDDLRALAASRTGYPHLEAGTHPEWLEELVTAGAEISNGYYEALLDHFDFAKSVRDPKDGLDRPGQELVAQMIAFATVSLARVLDRAFVEAGVTPPAANPSLESLFAVLDLPIAWVTRNLGDARERGLVEAQYQEWSRTGQVERTLTEDVRSVRDRARAAARAALPAPPAPAEPPAQPAKARLRPDSPLVDAPSIGPKTARRLESVGLRTVADLLAADASGLARQLGGWITAATVRDWQDQAKLLLEIPGLRTNHAKILVGSGYRTPEALAAAQPEELLQDVAAFVASPSGQRALHRDTFSPTLRDTVSWIGQAEAACPPGPRRAEVAPVELPS